MFDEFVVDADGNDDDGELNQLDMFKLDANSGMTEEEKADVFGVVSNLDRNMSTVYSLDGKGYKVDTLGVNVKMLSMLILLMNEVIYSDKMPYEIKKSRNGAERVVTLKMARLMDFLQTFDYLMFSDLAPSPELRLFFHVFRTHTVKHMIELGLWSSTSDTTVPLDVAKGLNDLVVKLRAEGKRANVKAQLSQWVRNADDNSKRLEEYINGLFERYARLVVIRLELRYRQTACLDQQEAMKWQQQMRERNAAEKFGENDEDPDYGDIPRVNILTVAEDWKHFKDNWRGKRSLFRHRVGHAASIEFGSIGGHHLHVALIFDGAHVRAHRWFGTMIGRYWEEVTAQRGYFRNLNRGKYKYPGTGIIEYHDTEKRRNLMKTLQYLAKKDQFVRVKASPKSKTWLTGHMPKPKQGRTGRPRKKGGVDLNSVVTQSEI